jgi:hypothetical protein
VPPTRKERNDKGKPRPHTRKEAVVQQAAKQQQPNVQLHRPISLIIV